MTCWLLENALVDSCGTLVPLKTYVRLRECDSRFDPHHLITKQRIKTEYRSHQVKYPKVPHRPLKDFLDDERNIVPACRRHHDLWHGARLQVPRSSLPWKVEAFAAELGLEWWLDAHYGELETEAA